MEPQHQLRPTAKHMLPPDIEFRKATAEDSDAFFRLRREAILHGCATFYSSAQLQAWTAAATDGRLTDPMPVNFYVARLAEEMVATGLVDVDSGRIDAMFVSPKHMRRGIGKAMMAHLERIAVENGVRRLALDATLNAAPFYRSLGFEGNARSTYTSTRGPLLDCVPMAKAL